MEQLKLPGILNKYILTPDEGMQFFLQSDLPVLVEAESPENALQQLAEWRREHYTVELLEGK